MLMRFLQRLGEKVVHAAVQALQVPYLRAKAFLDEPPPNRDDAERDTLLKAKFKRMNWHFLRRLNVIMPDTDNSDKIKVIAVMPTPSLETRLEGRDTSDACVVFCVVNFTRWDKEALLNEQNNEWMVNSGMGFLFTFAAITNNEYYKRMTTLMLSDIFTFWPREVMQLIADDISNDFTTYFMAVWTAPRTRRPWMLFGLNTPRDNCLSMLPAMQSFYDAREKAIETRGSQ